MSRLVEKTEGGIIGQDSIISFSDDSMDLIINGDIFTFECSIEYNKDIEKIAYTLREKFFDVSFAKNISFNQIFRKSIRYTPSLSKEKIPLYQPNIHFIFLILKN